MLARKVTAEIVLTPDKLSSKLLTLPVFLNKKGQLFSLSFVRRFRLKCFSSILTFEYQAEEWKGHGRKKQWSYLSYYLNKVCWKVNDTVTLLVSIHDRIKSMVYLDNVLNIVTYQSWRNNKQCVDR